MKSKVLILVMVLLALTASAHADDFGEGIVFFHNLDYDQSEILLKRALSSGLLTQWEAARAYEVLATISIARGETAEAELLFRQLLLNKPNYQPPDDMSPKIRRIFEKAKEGYMGQLSIQTDPPGEELVVNGKKVGKAPFKMEKAPPGDYRIEVKRNSKHKEQFVTVKPGEIKNVTVVVPPGDFDLVFEFGIQIPMGGRQGWDFETADDYTYGHYYRQDASGLSAGVKFFYLPTRSDRFKLGFGTISHNASGDTKFVNKDDSSIRGEGYPESFDARFNYNSISLTTIIGYDFDFFSLKYIPYPFFELGMGWHYGKGSISRIDVSWMSNRFQADVAGGFKLRVGPKDKYSLGIVWGMTRLGDSEIESGTMPGGEQSGAWDLYTDFVTFYGRFLFGIRY